VFLDSIERNSRETRNAYHRGLTHFQNFLNEKYPTLTVESILQPLIRNEINIYELLDNFVPFLIKLKLSVNSITLYMTAVRSYFAYYDIDVISSKFKRKVKMPKVSREDVYNNSENNLSWSKCKELKSETILRASYFRTIFNLINSRPNEVKIRGMVTIVLTYTL
jgi:site-specific recombinase XerD